MTETTKPGRCFICDQSKNDNPSPQKFVDNSESSLESGGPRQPAPANNLHTFVLHDLLEVSSDFLDKCSQQPPGEIRSGEWFILCNPCREQIDKARLCHKELIEVTNRFYDYRTEVVEAIRKSRRTADDTSGTGDVVQELRKFIAEANYADGSQQSRTKHLFGSSQMSQSDSTFSSSQQFTTLSNGHNLLPPGNELSPLVSQSPFLPTPKTETEAEDSKNSSQFVFRDNLEKICPVDSCGRIFYETSLMDKHVMLEHGLDLKDCAAESRSQSPSRAQDHTLKPADPDDLPWPSPSPPLILPLPKKKPGRPGRPKKVRPPQPQGILNDEIFTPISIPQGQVKRGPGRPKKADRQSSTTSGDVDWGIGLTPPVKRKRGRPSTRVMPVLTSYAELDEEETEPDLSGPVEVKLRSGRISRREFSSDFDYNGEEEEARNNTSPYFGGTSDDILDTPPLLPAKRGRGRPPWKHLVKLDMNTGTTTTTSHRPSALSIQAGTAKRGPGRPPRPRPVVEQSNETFAALRELEIESDGESPGYSRSSISETSTFASSSDLGVSNNLGIVKRKRGRPKKSAGQRGYFNLGSTAYSGNGVESRVKQLPVPGVNSTFVKVKQSSGGKVVPPPPVDISQFNEAEDDSWLWDIY